MIKIYDSSKDQYVTIASNRGDKLYTKSINFSNLDNTKKYEYDNTNEESTQYNDTNIVTIDDALTSISKEIKTVKEGIAWVYKNGTLGGGGGGSSQNSTFNILVNNTKVENNTYITTSGNDVIIDFSVKGLPNGKKITLSITKDGEYIDGYKNVAFNVSSKNTRIKIENVTNDSIITFSGYDNETFAIIESYSLNIKIAQLFIEGNENISFSYDLKSKNIYYDITTTAGVETRTKFEIIIYKSDSNNPLVYRYNAPTFTSSKKTIEFDIFNTELFINDDNEYLDLSSMLMEYDIDSNRIINNIRIDAYVETNEFTDLKPFISTIAIVYPDRITIDMFRFTSLNSIPEELYNENENMVFDITLRYNEDTQFYMYYRLYQINETEEYNIFTSSDYPDIPTMNRPNNTSFFGKTNKISISYDTLIYNGLDVEAPVFIEVKSWDLNYNTAPIDSIRREGTIKTKHFKFRSVSENSWKPYNLAFSGIDDYEENNYEIYAYWNQKDIPKITNKKTWNATLANPKAVAKWDYEKYIEYYNCNDTNNGLINSIDESNKLRLASKGYATIKNSDGSYFLPFGKVLNQNYENNWFLGNDCTQENWTISLLYKADIQANDDAVIFDYSIKDRENKIVEGIHITTKNVLIKFRSAGGDSNSIVYNIDKKISQNVINQLDIVFEGVENKSQSNKACSLKLYINGVMQSASVNDKSYYTYDNLPTQLYDDNNENIPIILGAKRNRDGSFNNFCDFDLYRIIFYKKALTKYHIMKNYIQGYYEVYRNENGKQDIEENNKLRIKNFFNNNGTCSLCINNPNDKVSYYTFKNNEQLYQELKNTNVLPVVYINVYDNGGVFYNNSKLRWAEGQVIDDKNNPNEDEKVITKKYNCEISITVNGNTISIGDDEDLKNNDYEERPSVSLQGTSTLGFVSKNYQIYCGKSNIVDEKGNKKEFLIQPFENMLPENEWIIKADVVDSGHANNAAIGSFINDFLSIYCERNGVDDNKNNNYAKELKHTTVGQPCILFMSYGGGKDNDGNSLPNYEYKGIYSFNLGRSSYFNLGYKVFDGYYKAYTNSQTPELKEIKYENHKVVTDNISFPIRVAEYNIIDVPYINTAVNNGKTSPVVCYECVENNNEVGSFQQEDTPSQQIIQNFYSIVYPQNAENNFGKESFSKIFKITSSLPLCDPNNDLTNIDSPNNDSYKTRHSYIRDYNGKFKLKGKDEFEYFNIDNISLYEEREPLQSEIGMLDLLTTPQSEDNELYAGLDWNYASSYFILACLFGLVDSLGKNLNIRSFDQKKWFTSFYDMDTGLGIDNEGKEIIKNDIYLDKFSNNDSNEEVSVYQNSYSNGGFNTCNSRLWNIIRNLKTVAYTEHKEGYYSENYRSMWDKLRTTFLRNPESFINNYYMKHNSNVGGILFNMDYDVKYINDAISKISGKDINSNASADQASKLYSSISLLHGDRINFIKDWFPKHVYFLDGVFDLGCEDKSNSITSKILYGEKESINSVYGYSSENKAITSSNNIDTAYRVVPSFARTNTTADLKTFYIKSNYPIFLIFNNSSIKYNRYYLPENKLVPISFEFASNSNGTFSMNHLTNIVNLDIIKDFNFSSIQDPNMFLLTSFNITDLNKINVNEDTFFDIQSLVNLNELKMANVKNAQPKLLEVNLSNSEKVNYIDISNSDVDRLKIYQKDNNNKGGVLEYLNISKTQISELDLTNQSLLREFYANDCNKLEILSFEGCEKLNKISTLPTLIRKINFNNCNSLTAINLNNMEQLTDEGFNLGHLENLKTFSYSHKKTKDKPIGITNLDFSGCPNIEDINLIGFQGEYITLNKKSRKTLKNLNISNSNIKYIVWYDDENDKKIYSTIEGVKEGIIDLMLCVNIESVNISNQKNIKYLLLPSGKDISNINILGCDSLQRIVGTISVNVNMFTNLSNFRFNEVCKYDVNDKNEYDAEGKITYTAPKIILNYENGEVELDASDSSGNISLNPDTGKIEYTPDTEHNNEGDLIIKYELNKLLTHYTFLEDGASITNSFNNTGINITDLYAILIKLKSWRSKAYESENNPEGYISTFNRTFANCNNIKTFDVNVVVNSGGRISNIITNSDYKAEIEYIKDNIFEGYEHLKELISTFEKCTNIKGYINDIFKPITHLTNIENVFNGCGELYINNDIFNNNKELEIINKPFSDNTIGVLYHGNDFPNYYPIVGKVRDNSGIMLNPDTFFKFNKELKEIINIFSNTKIQFNIEEENGVYKFKDIENIFKYNTKLKTIYNFLPNVYTGKSKDREPGELDLSNIFGGYYRYLINKGLEDDIKNIKEKFNISNIEDFDNFYPRELETLDYAFAIDKNKLNENRPTLKWDNIEYIFYNLLPKEENGIYTNTLKSCAYMFDYLAYLKDNDDYYDYTKDANFPIDIFNIKDKEGKYIKFANLESCEGLFMRAAFKKPLYFPGNIFQNCTYNGLNLSHLLEDTYMTPIILVNENDVDEEGDNYVCFTNCKLGDISSMFKNCFKGINKQDFNKTNYEINGYKLDKGGLHGTIPYKFFKNKGKITNMSSVFEGCCHLGTKVDLICDENGDYNSGTGNFVARDESCFYNIRKPNYETVVDVSNRVKDVSLLLDLVEQNNEGIWNWNAWSYDGTIFDKDYLNALNNIRLGENNDTYSEAKHRNISNYIDLIWLKGDTIIPDSSILLNLDNSKCKFANDNQLNSLKQSYYDASYLGLIKIDDTNNDYVYRIYYDADYDIKNVNFDSKLLASDKKQLWNCDSNTYIDLTGNNEPFNYRHTLNSDKDMKFISNYLCPMDLFRYSSSNCKIDNIFKNMSRFNNDDKIEKRNGYVYGLLGRIPPKLFTPLTTLTSMSNVFENCKGINPYSQSLDGLLYNFTFNSNIEIAEMNGLLKGCMLLGSLSNNLFVNNTSLVSLNEFVKNGYMPYHYAYNNEGYNDYINFIPKTLFINNGALTNLNNMFSKDNQSSEENVKNSFIYFDLPEKLLDVNKHSFLSNVSFMFANQNNSNCGIQRNSNNKKQFIDFTRWKNKITMDGCYSGANFDLSLIPKEMGGTLGEE